MDENDQDVIVPVIREEVHADAMPVVTGGVRVTKSVESHDEVLEQELRKSHVEVKRVKTDRVVDGPQSAQRVGNTLIIPVVSEVLRIEKQWVVTEEIHITEFEQRETFQQTISVNAEKAQVERLDSVGNAVPEVAPVEVVAAPRPSRATSILSRAETATPPVSKRKPLSQSRSILKGRPTDTK